MRLQKYLATCGVASRRASEEIIASGRVTVNGRPVIEQGLSIIPGTDAVEVDGRIVSPEEKRYFVLNKPVGVLCTCQDTHGRRTFLDFFPGIGERLYPVGRLDQDSEGLLIVTNDGELALRLMHPRHEVSKIYHVETSRPLTPDQRQRMRAGIDSEGERLTAEAVDPLPGRVGQYRIILKEGRKRQIRRMVQALGLRVSALRRMAVGSLELGSLPVGKVRALARHEVEVLFRESGLEGKEPLS